MADIASEAVDPPRTRRGLTLRLRLTLLYGAVFVAAGAGLLAVTYGLFKHNQNTGATAVRFRGINFRLPSGAEAWTIVAGGPGGPGGVSQVKLSSKPSPNVFTRSTTRPNFTSVPPAKLLQTIRKSGQQQVTAIARRAQVAVKTQQSNDASSLLEWSGIAFGVVALLSIALAWWLAGRALRPLRTMNTRARAISAENLHQRLGVDDRHDELGELATTFDALLARLEAAFESQRRFVANASHELRTPITLERTLVEVALADPDASIGTLRHVCERVVASTEQQERLLDALLTLARSEGGVAAGESVDLAVLVEEALLAREARLDGITVETELEPAVVIGDRALLERLVANLVENAIVHNEGGEERWIRISTGESERAPGLTIANGGETVEPERVDELFEPFRRGAGERINGRDGGLGLGLSIVRAVALAHGARIAGQALPGGGLEFELRFTAIAATTSAAKPPDGGLEPVSA